MNTRLMNSGLRYPWSIYIHYLTSGQVKEKLQDRLGIDEVVNQVLGVPIQIPGHEDDKFEIFL
jgi:hypothetical protein